MTHWIVLSQHLFPEEVVQEKTVGHHHPLRWYFSQAASQDAFWFPKWVQLSSVASFRFSPEGKWGSLGFGWAGIWFCLYFEEMAKDGSLERREVQRWEVVPGKRKPHPVLGYLINGGLPGGVCKVGSEGFMHRKHLEAHCTCDTWALEPWGGTWGIWIFKKIS